MIFKLPFLNKRNFLQKTYKNKLFTLGDFPIFYPEYKESVVKDFLTEQFLSDAKTYADKYENDSHWSSLINLSIEKSGIKSFNKKNILDIGTGAGNTIFPLLEKYKNSNIIASDLSIELLTILGFSLNKMQKSNNKVFLLQLNAEDLCFKQESFDLIVGGAILHHLFNPEITLAQCFNVLKEKGHTVFFEPFEEGNSILINYLYTSILSHNNAETLSEEAKNFLNAYINEYRLRTGTDKSADIYKQIDDKWFFTKKYISNLAEKSGFSDCKFIPINSNKKPFSSQTKTLLRLALGKQKDFFPEWVWEIFEEFESKFQTDFFENNPIEAIIILNK